MEEEDENKAESMVGYKYQGDGGHPLSITRRGPGLHGGLQEKEKKIWNIKKKDGLDRDRYKINYYNNL